MTEIRNHNKNYKIHRNTHLRIQHTNIYVMQLQEFLEVC